MTVELTAAQQQVVAHDGGLLRVRGGAGTGKTTSLLCRYLRLAARPGAHRVLVLARSRAAALRFRQAVLPHLKGGFESLSITTAWGVAHHILRRHGRSARLITTSQQWALVRELLASEAGHPELWPTLHPLVGRPAFVDEVTAAMGYARAAGYEPSEVHAAAAGAGPRWGELAAFMARYHHTLVARGIVDGQTMMAEAGSLLADPAVAEVENARNLHVLVDDYEAATPAFDHLVRRLTGNGGGLTVTGNPALAIGTAAACFQALDPASDVVLDGAFRHPHEPVLVECRHPSVEAEAVAGELLAAREDGVAWDEMAVLVRGVGGRARAVAQALARHGIPVSQPAGPAGPASEEPAVRALVDLLRWVDGDDGALERLLASPLTDLDPAEVRRLAREAKRAGTPLEHHPALAGLVAIREAMAARSATGDVADVAHHGFRLALTHLVSGPDQRPSAADERALDALVRFLDTVSRHVEAHPGTKVGDYLALLEGPPHGPDPWVSAPPPSGAVTMSSISAAAGQEWHTVVVAGCVEGELPRVDDGLRFFDRAVLGGAPLPSGGERRGTSVEDERRLFALALSRATGAVVATAAPEPGVLVSRLVESWEQRAPRLALEGDHDAPVLPPTAGLAPLWPDDVLSLSATQLDTYEDCPLKHAYRYALGVRTRSGVHAQLGNLVHQVLERFCDPNGAVPPAERTQERLHQLAEECWREDLAPYRPQLEEARRDLFEMLDLWWDREGGTRHAPVVLATEHRFEVDVGPHHLTGRIDRIDRSDDGAGLRVVDYKTGKSKPKPADVAEDLQLATYHLGASRDPELSALGPVRQLRLLHLRSMSAFEQEITPDHARVTEERVLATAARLGDEELRPAVDADCDHCELQRLCPLWPQGREVGQE